LKGWDNPIIASFKLDILSLGRNLQFMNYSVLIEPVEESKSMPGFYYAHVPTLGLTTHGAGIEGAITAAKDLIALWLEGNGRTVQT